MDAMKVIAMIAVGTWIGDHFFNNGDIATFMLHAIARWV